jgi:hypothetical protein
MRSQPRESKHPPPHASNDLFGVFERHASCGISQPWLAMRDDSLPRFKREEMPPLPNPSP